jgi:hypothetical protein
MASPIFIPNEEQKKCIININTFIKEHKPYSKLLINGSAGTGKTSIIISSIINILINQIILHIDEIIKESTNNKHKPRWGKIGLNNFIISAPTNKAKDVLFTKYNIYIEEQLSNILHNASITQISPSNIISLLNSKISFLTVSQVLSISRVVNEKGIEEFTKGNDKKITDKYDKAINTSIIVDECSMIDKNTARLLELIKCPNYSMLPFVKHFKTTQIKRCAVVRKIISKII